MDRRASRNAGEIRLQIYKPRALLKLNQPRKVISGSSIGLLGSLLSFECEIGKLIKNCLINGNKVFCTFIQNYLTAKSFNILEIVLPGRKRPRRQFFSRYIKE
jgi:hypothetical protein